jgi:hypothetical protein
MLTQFNRTVIEPCRYSMAEYRQVRVRVHACALNPADWAVCAGLIERLCIEDLALSLYVITNRYKPLLIVASWGLTMNSSIDVSNEGKSE